MAEDFHSNLNKNREFSIVPYEPGLAAHFRDLNLAWISRYFKVEPEDLKMLNDPEKEIMDKGGAIVFAIAGNVVAGTGALVKINSAEYELAKMATRDDYQGKGIGYAIGSSLIKIARASGADKVILDTNSSLKSALHLYEKLGFRYVDITAEQKARYERADVMMVLDL